MSITNKVEVISRAVIVNDNNILLCKVKDANWYFLPGGHVECGEPVQEALIRELKEECNISNVQIDNLLGIIENKFPLEDREHHEINFFFKVTPTANLVIDNQEDHIGYEFIKVSDVDNVKILPPKVKEIILNNLQSEKISWTPIKSR